MASAGSSRRVDGTSLLRYHLALSLLSKRPIEIVLTGGLKEHEVNLLRFVDVVTGGSSQLSMSSDQLTISFKPGFIIGGTITYDVPPSRSVAYIIEFALLVLPFAKYPSVLTLTGSTQSDDDLCIDTMRTTTVRWMQCFGVECSMRIVRRGASPTGGGCVILELTNVRKLRSVALDQRGLVKRIRGIAFGSGCAADLVQRTATSAKGVLLDFLPDVYVVTEVATTGGSGFGIMLVAETTTKQCVVSQEATAAPREPPEAVGERAARLLLDQISAGGCVDAHHQALVLLLMALGPDEASTVRFGSIGEAGVSALVLIEQYLGVQCAMKQEPVSLNNTTDVPLPLSTLVSCIGSNTVNVTKKGG